MTISKESALELVASLKQALDHADYSLHHARRMLSTEDAACYQRIVGEVMGNTYLNHIRPLLDLFPTLSMPGFRMSPTDPAAGSLHTFFSQIDYAILAYQAQLQACETAGIFRSGAFHETMESVEKLRAFARAHDLFLDLSAQPERYKSRGTHVP